MSATVRPFLMFEGKAEEAMSFYVSLFPEGKVTDIVRYGPGEQGAEGSVKIASFTLSGLSVRCIDSPMKNAFTFRPAFRGNSIFPETSRINVWLSRIT